MKGFCLAGASYLRLGFASAARPTFVGLAALASCFVACANDDASPGARDLCAQGGELNDCPDTERTAAEVCWRLVDCGAIAIDGEQEFSFDWGRCMDFVEGIPDDRSRLVQSCIAASQCDQLRVDGSPNNPNTEQMYCVVLGRNF